MKARLVRVKVIESATAALLETGLQAFLAPLTEETLLSIDYKVDAGVYSALVLYTR